MKRGVNPVVKISSGLPAARIRVRVGAKSPRDQPPCPVGEIPPAARAP